MKISLLTRIVLALAAVALVPLGVAAWQLTAANRGALEEQVLNTLAVTASTSSELAAGHLEYLGPMEAVGRSPLLGPGVLSPAARNLLADLVADENVAGLSIVERTGVEVFRAQKKPLAGSVEAVLAAPGTGPLVAVWAGEKLWLRLERDVPALGARMRLVADGMPLVHALKPPETGGDFLAAIGTKEGQLVVAQSAAAALGSFPPGLLENARAGRTSGASRYRGADGRPFLGAFAPIPGTSWFVVTRQPAVNAEGAAEFLRRRALLALAAALSLAGLVGVGAYVSVVRPIRGLVAAQRRLAGVAGKKKQGDEISDLKTSFESLERQIKEQSAVGKVFLGRFQVIELLGAGGMGAVFSGWDPKLQRKVALKTIRLQNPASGTPPGQDVVGNLLREAVTTASLNHPNVVAVYDVEDAPEAAFVAMELVEGMSLEDRLAKVFRIPYQQVVPLGAAIARGLSAAHALGMVHHDVKPANILLGRGGAIKVTDFGIAQLVTNVAKRADVVFGTPGYLPPEALRGEGYDPSGDLFGLGAILYRCLTGNRAFSGKDNRAVIASTMKDEVAPPKQLVGAIPEDLDALVLSLLAKDRAGRPANAKDVAERLEGIAAKGGWRWNASFLEAKTTVPEEPAVKPTQTYEKPESVFLATALAADAGARPGGRAPAA